MATAPFIPSGPGVSTSFAPSATSTFLRSMLIVSGMVRTHSYPRAAAAKARAMPVFPLVASRIALPFFRRPRFSASHTIEAPIRHFTE